MSFLILFAFQNSPIYAFEGHRPKIALVLGGGGARGGAHIGVLKVLEENRIPIDYIVGTSMGAVVGSSYASGSSPKEMKNLFTDINWDNLFSDRPSRKNLSFRHKEEQRQLIDFEMGLNDWKLQLPRGLIAGQKTDFLLRSMTLPSTGINNFDDLPIPFRAISTDIETGEAVTHSRGDLAVSVRASMAIPGIFTPVDMDGKVLVDGGLSKNLPVDVAKEFKPDVIIAVSVSVPLAKRDKLKSMISIYSQLIDIMTLQNVKPQIALLGKDDILIEPDLGDLSPADFQKIGEAIQYGERDAIKIVDKLKKYSVSPEEYERFLASQRRDDMKPIKIDAIEISPATRVTPERIEAKINIKPGTVLDTKTLQKNLNSIYELGDFQQVDFNIKKDDGKNTLVINTKAKEWGPNYLRFGLNIEDDFEGDSYYNLLAEYKMTELNKLGAEWKNDIQIGRTLKYFTDFYQPLDYKDFLFIDPQFILQQQIIDIYDNNKRIAQYRIRSVGGGVDVGMNLGTYARGKFGILTGRYNAAPIVGDESLPRFNVNETALVADLAYDQLDDANFPKYGGFARANLYMARDGLGAKQSYDKLEFRTIKAVTLKRHTFIASVDGGTNLGGSIPFYNEFTLGGFLSLSGYRVDELRGQNYGLARGVYYYNLMNIPSAFVDGIYLGGSLESGNTWAGHNFFKLDKFLFGGSVFIGIDTIFGPVYLGYGLAERSDDGQFYLHVGQVF